MTNNNNKPVHEIRLGRIVASVWSNPSAKGNYYAVTASRLYRKGQGWARTASFGRDDLPLVAKVMNDAHTWLFGEAARVAPATIANTAATAAPARNGAAIQETPDYHVEDVYPEYCNF